VDDSRLCTLGAELDAVAGEQYEFPVTDPGPYSHSGSASVPAARTITDADLRGESVRDQPVELRRRQRQIRSCDTPRCASPTYPVKTRCRLDPAVSGLALTACGVATLSISGGGNRYHLAAKLSEAVDAVRRAEIATRPELKHTRWLWLKNWSNLSTGQRRELQLLLRPSAQLATARALRWREDFQAFYDQDPSYATEYLRSWCAGAKRSRLPPIKEFVDLVRRHWDGIIAWHRSRASNGLLEGTNSLIQAAKARARGYRNKDKMITIAYLIAGKLPLPTVTNPSPGITSNPITTLRYPPGTAENPLRPDVEGSGQPSTIFTCAACCPRQDTVRPVRVHVVQADPGRQRPSSTRRPTRRARQRPARSRSGRSSRSPSAATSRRACGPAYGQWPGSPRNPRLQSRR
jgi:transposase